MMRGLLAKELREHQMLLLFLFLLVGGGLSVIAGNSLIHSVGGSGFFAVRFSLITLFPLACLVLNHALIATEFRQKTQLFLEGLPLPRWRMLFVKYALGLSLMLAIVVAMLVVAWWPTRGIEAMTPRFALLLLLNSAGWAWFLYALFFAHAFLGRYRIVFAVLVLLAFFSLQSAGVEVANFGPIQLIDERFGFERHHFPAKALWTTAGLGALLTVLGFGLGLVRDATVASLLAEKMSSREKVFMTFLGLVGLLVSVYLFEHFTNATPVKLPGASEGFDGVAQVYAAAAVDAPSNEETAQLAKTAQEAAKELADLATYLRCGSLPPVFIVHRRDLAANEFQNGDLKTVQGLMVRVNLTAPEFKPGQLQAWITREILITRTNGIAERERNAWVIDGFPEWRTNREGTPEHAEFWPRIAKMAGEALPRDFSREHLNRWYTVRRDAGTDQARALAAVGLDVLAQRHGEEACRQFLSDLFSREYPVDARGWLRDVFNPVEKRLRRAANISLDDFVNEWREAVPPKPPQP
jgi:hypothetical protein